MNAACWWLLAGVALALFLFLRLQTVSGKMYLGVVCGSAMSWFGTELVLVLAGVRVRPLGAGVHLKNASGNF